MAGHKVRCHLSRSGTGGNLLYQNIIYIPRVVSGGLVFEHDVIVLRKIGHHILETHHNRFILERSCRTRCAPHRDEAAGVRQIVHIAHAEGAGGSTASATPERDLQIVDILGHQRQNHVCRRAMLEIIFKF